jgi:3-phosphoshikimate 1-carboxyvinyltransferase
MLHPAAVETYDDHRIAMAFAVAGLKLAGVRIINPGCVAKTYPEFFKDLANLGAAALR